MQHGPARAVEPLSLAGQSSAVLLVVDQDVKHGAALLIALSQTALQHLYVRAQSALDPTAALGFCITVSGIAIRPAQASAPRLVSVDSPAPSRGRSSSAPG